MRVRDGPVFAVSSVRVSLPSRTRPWTRARVSCTGRCRAPSAASGVGTLQDLLGPTYRRSEPESVSSVDVRELVFFGAGRSAELVGAIRSELKVSAFDAILVLTDDGSYEQERDRKEKVDLGAPI